MNDTSIIVKNLHESKEYIFKVSAVNKNGTGAGAQTDIVKAVCQFNPPSKPTCPDVSSVDRDSCVISWGRPESNGGSEILHYIVEKKSRSGLRWISASRKEIHECRCKATDLTENEVYEFHVIAVNAAGQSQPSDVSKPIKITEASYPPGIYLH